MNIGRGLFFTLFIFNSFIGFSQLNFSGEATSRVYISSEDKLPFWLYSNQRGRINDSTTVSLFLTARENWKINQNADLEIGGGILYQDAAEEEVDLDELYIQYKNSWIRIIGGIKQIDELYDGLSGTNGNMLWSLNAKPIPGIQLNTVKPIYFLFNKHLGISGTWGEFLLDNDKNRFVKKIKIHKKSLFINYRSNNELKIKLGIEHFVQWGGESPESHIGIQPKSFSDYLKIITGQGGQEDAFIGEQTNALGNHLGSYELRISKVINNIYYEIMYSHPFEDGSGMLYYNRPDGRYGIFVDLTEYSLREKPWIQKFMYEFYYTKDQSHERSPLIHKWDNYFNNGLYQSGWTYKDNVLGLPFFTINQYGNDKKPSIGNNRIIVHHFGLKGNLMQKIPYKLFLSYRNNNGHVRNLNDFDGEEFREDDPRGRIILPHEIVSTYLDVNLLNSFLNINLELGADFSSENSNLGVGIKINKTF
ncbi:capsule assembly protein Wzi [Gillisia mitskevichiae]|uniref:Capsule assembly protein Wzi n=1 Tax=Gillisia mitskevichiae TaxID=270921 RepID=A0A495PLA4_9FLAO|nr:capsule assembly Wzi family protein [Gillisia mitskevichiae]RKS50475.1 capsule assembly protein Wzi [Gillisia mitskevichiae]